MNYTITESQKDKIINALRFAAETGNARAAHEWKKLADYLEVLDPGKPTVNTAAKSSLSSSHK